MPSYETPGYQSTVGHQVAQEFRVVDHLVVATERGVLVLHGVKAVRTARDNLLGPASSNVAMFDLGHLLEEVLVAHATGRIAGAGLPRTEDAEGDAGAVKHARHRLDLLATSLVERSRAADPVEVLDVIGNAPSKTGTSKSSAPSHSVRLFDPESPRVALVLQVSQQQTRLGGEPRLHEHLVTSHVDDGVDVLDVDRALLDAGTAGGAATTARQGRSWSAPMSRRRRRCRPRADGRPRRTCCRADP